jgi:hypothetical protein
VIQVPEKVKTAAIAGSDLVYIDDFGMVKIISAITVVLPPTEEGALPL